MERHDLFSVMSGETDLYNVLKYLKLNVRFFGSVTEDPPKEPNADFEYIRILSEQLKVTYESVGPPTVGNESTRCEFASPFVKIAVASLDSREISLKKKHAASGSTIEYVVRDGHNIVLIVVVGDDNWEQGRSRLLREMHTVYHECVFSDDLKVYGGVCTGDAWEFLMYSKKSGWEYYGVFLPFPKRLDSDVSEYEKACKEVFFILRGMIKGLEDSRPQQITIR